MKFICTSDWHIRATRPRCRVDEDWIETQKKTLNQIAEIAEKNQCNVYCVGDVFNSNSDVSFECIKMIQDFSNRLSESELKFGILAGNHDLPYHNSENLNKSAIGVLLDSWNIDYIRFIENSVSASNFDEQDNKESKYVFKHTLVFPDAKSIPPNFDGTTAKELLSEFPKAEWIFTGDYHHSFHYEKNGRHVVNPGCILRQASDMKDYQPGVYLVDTGKNLVEFIPLKDSEKLIDDSYITANDEREERIDSFVSKLKNVKSISLNFTENVENSLSENNFSEEFVDMVNELMEV